MSRNFEEPTCERPLRRRVTSKKEILDLLPDQGSWSEAKYLGLTDHPRRLVEFNDGFVEILPWPTSEHQEISARLLGPFDTCVSASGGIVLFAALRVRLWPGKVREPDLVVLRSRSDPRRQNRFWTGADLVVEVVSEDDPERDLVTKRSEYARARIPEYWIANPIDRTITVLTLGKRRYRRHGVFKSGQVATSVILAGFEVDVAAIFDTSMVRKKR